MRDDVVSYHSIKLVYFTISAYITMPSGKKAYPKIDDNKDGTVTVRYQPQETGLHELHVCYNQQEINGRWLT